ncbi:hypothetical protein E4U55_003907 [Claviceps digitariae]|nr:hypothetical protein E4U55_003907 [Claviceps digitariae]
MHLPTLGCLHSQTYALRTRQYPISGNPHESRPSGMLNLPLVSMACRRLRSTRATLDPDPGHQATRHAPPELSHPPAAADRRLVDRGKRNEE